jgi:hypothetical protein
MTPPTELTLFTITTLFGCTLSLVCLPWQINSMNVGSVLLCSWLLVGSFMLFVNSLAMNAPIWCDICEQFCNTTIELTYPYNGYSYEIKVLRRTYDRSQQPAMDAIQLLSS